MVVVGSSYWMVDWLVGDSSAAGGSFFFFFILFFFFSSGLKAEKE
jgi:hypothetical protein